MCEWNVSFIGFDCFVWRCGGLLFSMCTEDMFERGVLSMCTCSVREDLDVETLKHEELAVVGFVVDLVCWWLQLRTYGTTQV